jgi:hypothetical protein
VAKNVNNVLDHLPDSSDLNTNGLEIKIIYLPPNTTSLLQPMDQEAVSTFKAYYLLTTLMGTANTIQVSNNVTLRDYCKSFDNMKEISNSSAIQSVVTIQQSYISIKHNL